MTTVRDQLRDRLAELSTPLAGLSGSLIRINVDWPGAPDVEIVYQGSRMGARLEGDGGSASDFAAYLDDAPAPVVGEPEPFAGRIIRSVTKPRPARFDLSAGELAQMLDDLAEQIIDETLADLALAVRVFVHPDLADDVGAEPLLGRRWPFAARFRTLTAAAETVRAFVRSLTQPPRRTPEALVDEDLARWMASGVDRLMGVNHDAHLLPPPTPEVADAADGPWEPIDIAEVPPPPAFGFGVGGSKVAWLKPITLERDGGVIERGGRFYRWQPDPETPLSAELILNTTSGEPIGYICPPHPERENQLWELDPKADLAWLFIVEQSRRRQALRHAAQEKAETEGGDADDIYRRAAELAERAEADVGLSVDKTSLFDLRGGPLSRLKVLRDGPVDDDGRYRLDLALSRWLQGLGGQRAAEAAVKAADGASAGAERAEGWGRPYVWARSLVEIVWLDQIKGAISADLTPYRAVVVNGDDYAKMGKVISPAVWSFGAPGADGHAAVAADLVRDSRTIFVPRGGYHLSRGGQRAPHQADLPLVVDDAEPLAVAVANRAGRHGDSVVSVTGGKLALLALAMESAGDGLMETTLGGLTDMLCQGRRVQPRDRQRVADGLREIRRVSIILPDGRDVQCFSADTAAGAPRADMVIRFGLASTLRRVLAELADKRKKGSPAMAGLSGYRGHFIMNLSGAFRLSGAQPVALRMLVRVSAEWNAHRTGDDIDHKRLPWRSALELAQWVHALPASPSASAKKDAAKKTRDAMGLLESEGLLTIATQGKTKNRRYQLLPPDPYLQAWHSHRGGGARRLEG